MPWKAQRNGRGSQGQLPRKASKQVIIEPHSDGWASQMKTGSRVSRQKIWECLRIADLVESGDLFRGLLNRRQMQLGLHFWKHPPHPVWGRQKKNERRNKAEEVVMLVPAWVVGMGIECGGRVRICLERITSQLFVTGCVSVAVSFP